MAGLGWGRRKRLSDTDANLYYAYSIYKANLCGCGCGQWAPEAHDPMTAGEWAVDDSTVCEPGAVLQQWQKDDSQHAEVGTIPVVRRMGADEADRFQAQRERRRKAGKSKAGRGDTEGGLA